MGFFFYNEEKDENSIYSYMCVHELTAFYDELERMDKWTDNNTQT